MLKLHTMNLCPHADICLGVQSVDEVVRRGRLRSFEHVERKSEDDWV